MARDATSGSSWPARLAALLVIVATLAGGLWKLQDGLVTLPEPVRALGQRVRDTLPAGARQDADAREPASDPAPRVEVFDAVQRHGSFDGSWTLRRVFVPRPTHSVGEPAPEPAANATAASNDRNDVAVEPPAGDEPTSAPAGRAPSSRAAPSVNAAAPSSLPEHLVSVILVGREGRVAVVDSTVVQAGDELAAGEIVGIHERGVVVRAGTGFVDYILGTPRAQPRSLADGLREAAEGWERRP